MLSHRMSKLFMILASLGVVLFSTGAIAGATSIATNHSAQIVIAALSPNASVFATGLDNPRGLKFGPDGALYVAEGGTGGSDSAVGKCDQVPGPVGPYTGNNTGARISKFDTSGNRSTVAEKLPSSQTTQETGGFVSGVGDIAFVGNTLYAVLAGAGCSHGVPDVPNALLKVNADGTTTQVADLSAFLKANPVKQPFAGDFEPDGTWYSLLTIGNALFAIEPNHGELDKITTEGQVSRVIDISASQGHIVPTVMALGNDGNFYVGNLGGFPASANSKILKITPSGEITEYAKGLTTVLGVAFNTQGQLFALETSAPVTTQGPPVSPGTGRVVRVESDGTLVPIATGLTLPTGMTFGPDGKLYVSNKGFGLPPGAGEIVRVDITGASIVTLPTTGAPNHVWYIYVLVGLGILLSVSGWRLYHRTMRQ